MVYFIGIDTSTTATKALLMDERGDVLGVATNEYPYETPQPLWSEQDPSLWWHATTESIRQVLAKTGTDASAIKGIGLTGQMHGLVLLDKEGEVLRPAILWNDQRTGAQCDAIRGKLGRERLIQITGNDALTGFTAPKILWVQEHESELWKRTRHILLPKDYVRYKLTGEFASDRAGGAGTILFDLAKRDWSQEVLDALGIPSEYLPKTYEGTDVTGTLSPSIAKELGLPAGIPVYGGGGDQAAAAVGTGAVKRRGLAQPGYIRGGVCHHRRAVHRTRRAPARLLPFRAWQMASDGGYALGGGQPALAPRCLCTGHRL